MQQTPRMTTAVVAIAAMLCPVSAHADDCIIGLTGNTSHENYGTFTSLKTAKASVLLA